MVCRWVFLDLREAGGNLQQASRRALMRENNLRTRHVYRTRRSSAGKPSVLIPSAAAGVHGDAAKQSVGHRITYIRTWQGWLYPDGRHGPVLAQNRPLIRSTCHSP